MSDFRETLYTINKKGERKWVYPTILSGFFRNRRLVVAYLLMAIYLLMPWIEVGGTQAVLLNIPDRSFTFFGSTLWATDTKFLFVTLALLALSLFFFTALLGRVWCGWACPETVFLEFLFRPIETFIEGSPAQRLKLDQQPWGFQKIRKKLTKYLVYAILAWLLASTALAYFIGRDRLMSMMSGPPWANWGTFVLTLIMMTLLLFQFGWFREQFCTVLCPYARFQSVLLDPHSLLVGYDMSRGEPRGKGKRIEGDGKGDCIDCGLCVRVCPTGIDIRNGLQLECIQCAACADACDSVMAQIGKPLGLVRYSTEKYLAHERTRFARPRIVAYAFGIIVLISSFVYLLKTRQLSEFQIVRPRGAALFAMLEDGRVSNQIQVHLSNKNAMNVSYQVSIAPQSQASMSASDINLIQLISPLQPFLIKGQSMGTLPVFLNFPSSILKRGKSEITIEVAGSDGFRELRPFSLFGPES